MKQVLKRPGVFTAAAKGTSAEILMYDEIGLFGITDADFARALASLGDVKNITLRVNSIGGDVFMGVGIYNALRQHPATITAQVDGVAASIATTIIMAAQKITMADNAMLMIHNAMMDTFGDANQLRASADLLEQVRDSTMVPAYARSGKSVADIRAIMDEEVWYSAQSAIENGWADTITEMPVKSMAAKAKYDLSAFKHPPETLKATDAELKQDIAEVEAELAAEQARIAGEAAIAAERAQTAEEEARTASETAENDRISAETQEKSLIVARKRAEKLRLARQS